MEDRKEWLKSRKLGIGASDVAAILGISPYQSIYQLWLDKTSDTIEDKSNFIMKKGNAKEPIARLEYELLCGYNMSATNMISPLADYYRCSLDGYNKQFNVAIEIKYIGKTFKDICPPHYFAQIQWQYFVSGCEEINLVQINDDNEIHVLLIAKDDAFIADAKAKVDAFWNDHVLTKIPPASDVEIITDKETEVLLDFYRKTKLMIDQLEKSLEEYSARIKTAVKTSKASCNGYSLQWITRGGSVNYKNIPELTGIDLNKYRGKETRYFQIKEMKAEVEK